MVSVRVASDPSRPPNHIPLSSFPTSPVFTTAKCRYHAGDAADGRLCVGRSSGSYTPPRRVPMGLRYEPVPSQVFAATTV